MDLAIPLYAAFVSTYPDNADVLHLLGRAYLDRRDLDEARHCFERVAALQPANCRNLECLGDTLQRLGLPDGARTVYRDALARGGDRTTLEGKLASIAFALEHLRSCRQFKFRADLLAYAMASSPPAGLVVELGVAAGVSMRFLAALTDQPVYGFDSFTGLPTEWRPGFAAGTFAQPEPPTDMPANVHLVVGAFADTLPEFARAHAGPIRLMHVDCDLYASAKTVFDTLGDRLTDGSVVVFDDYLNYAGWERHEHRAFEEFKARTGRRCEFIAWVGGGMQIAARIF